MQRLFGTITNEVWKITEKWGKTTRNILLFCCCAVLMAVFFFGGALFYGLKAVGSSMIIGTVLIVLMSICSIDRKMSYIKWSPLIYYPMLAFGLGILIIATIHPVGAGYITLAIDLAFVFPLFYYIWINRGDFETLFNNISVAILVNAVISFIYCLILAGSGRISIQHDRIAAFAFHPNILGMLGTITFISSIYLVMQFRNKVFLKSIFSAGIGIGAAYSILPASRTAFISTIAVLIVAVIFSIKLIGRETVIISRSIMSVLIIIIVSIAFLSAGLHIDNINMNARNKIAKVEQGEMTTDSEKEQAIEETNMKDTQDKETRTLSDRFGFGTNLNSVSSGRLGIWQIYVSHFSWLGEDIDTFTDELIQPPEKRAHNNFIDYTCRFGYVVGFIYCVFYLSCSASGIIILIGKEHNKGIHFMMVSCIGIYALYALLEISSLAFHRCIPCMFFLIIMPVVGKTTRHCDGMSLE